VKTFAEYEKAALRTAPVGVSLEHDIRHAVMGFITESAELVDAMKKQHAYGKPLDFVNLREEVGDIMWYLPLMCRGLGIALRDLAGADLFDDYKESSWCAERHESDALAFMLVRTAAMATERQANHGLAAAVILSVINRLARPIGATLEQIATLNIAKLQKRYPDKFTTEAALNRDIDAERKVLEGEPKDTLTTMVWPRPGLTVEQVEELSRTENKNAERRLFDERTALPLPHYLREKEVT
jgi:NTP pyrophosphatase (non-canonical NTP hydrolase)